MRAVQAHALGVVVPVALFLGDPPVVRRLHPGGRSLDPVASNCSPARSARVEAQDEPIGELLQLEVTRALWPDEMAAHSFAGYVHERLEALVPRMLVDVELLVAPSEERKQDSLVHARDGVVAEPLGRLAHVAVRHVDVAIVCPPPHLLGLVHRRQCSDPVGPSTRGHDVLDQPIELTPHRVRVEGGPVR